jgi:hypothetical protein
MASAQNLAGLAALAALGAGVYTQRQRDQAQQAASQGGANPNINQDIANKPLSDPMFNDYEQTDSAVGAAGTRTIPGPGGSYISKPIPNQPNVQPVMRDPAAQAQQDPVARRPVEANPNFPRLDVAPLTQSYTRTKGGPTAEELQAYQDAKEMAAKEAFRKQEISSGKKTDKSKYTMKEMAKDPMLKEAAAHMLPSGAGLKGIAALAKAMANSPASKGKEYFPHELTPQIGVEPLKIGSEQAKLGMKRGGTVKKMAKGGMTSKPMSKASSRGDGIASKGKTKGRFV